MSEKQLEGFTVQDYFVVFPEEDELIKEEGDGRYYVNVDIYKIGKNQDLTKLENTEVTPEIEQLISERINNMITAGLQEVMSERKEEPFDV